jgi:hypothetical protein
VRTRRNGDGQGDADDVHRLFRQVNDRVRTLNEAFEPILSTGEWVCECADTGCVERLELSVAEYDEIAAHAERFVAIAGHEQLGVDRIVERVNGYVVVERRRKAGAESPR